MDEGQQFKWYVVKTQGGHERKAKLFLEEQLRINKLEHLVEEIFIPSEKIETHVHNKITKRTVTYYPGYIFIRMGYSADLWNVIIQNPKVASFLGSFKNPQVVPDEEVKVILEQIKTGIKQAEVDSTYRIGQSVRITEGPFIEFKGNIESIDQEKNRLVVMVNIFGRATPVELSFGEIISLEK